MFLKAAILYFCLTTCVQGAFLPIVGGLGPPAKRDLPVLSGIFSPSAGPGGIPIVSIPIIPTFGIPTVSLPIPTSIPIPLPTDIPTALPTSLPVSVPIGIPTALPTSLPLSVPTEIPTALPTSLPVSIPNDIPTVLPTSLPVSVPTEIPTAPPTSLPVSVPTDIPTALPTSLPITIPTSVPTAIPTSVPVTIPTSVPTSVPTAVPTSIPTSIPSTSSSSVPVGIPTGVAPVNLGTAGQFAILAQSGISSVSQSSITGDIGNSPLPSTAITGFNLTLDASGTFAVSPQVVGRVLAADYKTPTPSTLQIAIGDMQTAFNDANGRLNPDGLNLGAGLIGGLTFTPGLYKWTSDVLAATSFTLVGGPTDVFIFQIAQTYTLSTGVQVILAGGALTQNIIWVVSSGVILGSGSHHEGVILGKSAITANTGSSVNGRLFAQTKVALQVTTVVSL